MKGVWISDYETTFYDNAGGFDGPMKKIKSKGYKKVYISNYTAREESPFLFDLMPITYPGEYVNKRAFGKASLHGLTPYAWLEYGLKVSRDSHLVKKHPNIFIKNKDGSIAYYLDPQGGVFVWVNPRSEEGKAYLLSLVKTSLKNRAIGGIHLDDNWSVPAKFGNYSDSLYQVTKEVKQLIDDTAKKQNRTLKLSLSANPINFARNNQNQNWLRWVRDGVVDEMIIQVYRSPEQLQSTINASGYHQVKNIVPTSIGIHASKGSPQKQKEILSSMDIEPTVFTWGHQEIGDNVRYLQYASKLIKGIVK